VLDPMGRLLLEPAPASAEERLAQVGAARSGTGGRDGVGGAGAGRLTGGSNTSVLSDERCAKRTHDADGGRGRGNGTENEYREAACRIDPNGRRSYLGAVPGRRGPGRLPRPRTNAMALWNRLFGGRDAEKVDYYREGLELLKVGKYHEALTSFRLAQRESPTDEAVSQQIAITYTRIGMTDEAKKTYRNVLARDPGAAGAHYGLAFLVLREGRGDEAVAHLRAFLAAPPDGPEAQRHIDHARETLRELGAAPESDGV